MSWPKPFATLLPRLAPAYLLARACGYRVKGLGALAKSRQMLNAPALARAAEPLVQGNESKEARTTMVMLLVKLAPHILAAAWKALSRWTPSVVPVLPPTGATGVGSLNPTPGALMFRMTIVAAENAGAEHTSATRPSAALAPRTRRALRLSVFISAPLSAHA